MTLNIRKDGTWVNLNPNKIGSIKATASGALSAGDPAILNSDGTVSKVAGSEITLNTDGAENFFVDTNRYRGGRIIHVPDGDYFVVVYMRHTGNINEPPYELKARAATVSSSGNITFGDEYTVVSSTSSLAQARAFNLCYDPDLKKVLCIWVYYNYDNNGDHNYFLRGKYIHSSDGGNTLTFGTENTNISNSNNQKKMMSFDYNTGINKFLLVYTEENGGDPNNHWDLEGQVLTGSGDSISAGSVVTLRTNQDGTEEARKSLSVVADATTSFIVTYYDDDGVNYYDDLVALGVSVSGTTPTASYYGNIGVALHNSNTGMLEYNPDKNMFIAMYTTGNGVLMRLLTISGNTISASSEISYGVSTAEIKWGSLGYDPITKHIYLYYAKGTNPSFDYPYVAKLEILSSTSINVAFISQINTTPIEYEGVTYTEYSSEHFWAAGLTHHIFVYSKDNGNSNGHSIGKGVAKATKVQNTNLTANNFLGFSKSAYANSDTATINSISSIDTNKSGLTTGQKYYVQVNGTLSTTPATPKVEAGVALSPTNLLISGSQMVGGSSKPSLNRPFATKGWWIPFT